MTIKELKQILTTANDNDEIEVIHGQITLIEHEPKPKFKFSVGDKVRSIINPELTYTIIGQFVENKEPMYNLKDSLGETSSAEKWLILIPQDITDKIKTFEDACEWCEKNGHIYLVGQHNVLCNELKGYKEAAKQDLLSFFKLRIVTAALNEGWEPTDETGELKWFTSYDSEEIITDYRHRLYIAQLPKSLWLKSANLAAYAAKQFRSLYVQFCGCNERK